MRTTPSIPPSDISATGRIEFVVNRPSHPTGVFMICSLSTRTIITIGPRTNIGTEFTAIDPATIQ